jgi:hypothetical protein
LKVFQVWSISFKTTVIHFLFLDFRLWINENLIKDDLETLREASKRNSEEGKKSFNNGSKKVKV